MHKIFNSITKIELGLLQYKKIFMKSRDSNLNPTADINFEFTFLPILVLYRYNKISLIRKIIAIN
jgi:hypothetical protein